VPNAITWHLKAEGGIRSEANQELYIRDEQIFRSFIEYGNKTIVVLNCGFGDHIVFSHLLPDLDNPIIFGCYPEVLPCKSIAKAQSLFGDLDQWNIYKKMNEWNWTESLESAFRKLYKC